MREIRFKNQFMFLATVLMLVFISTAAFAGWVPGTETATQIVPGQFIVKYKALDYNRGSSIEAMSGTISKYNVRAHEPVFKQARNTKAVRRLNLDNVHLMKTDKSADIWQIVNELNRNPMVEYAEPVYRCTIDATPNDPFYANQFQLPQVGAPDAWDSGYGSSDVIIGVIDTGVEWYHEDLAAIIWENEAETDSNGIDDDENGFIDDVRGWDFVDGVSGTEPGNAAPGEDGEDPDNDPRDVNGHGTHVSGISAAHTNNGIGVASVSAGVRVMPIRIGYLSNDGNGYGFSTWMAQAHIYAADNGADITNLSFGNSGQVLIDAAYYAFLNGVLVVESAGNGNAITPSALGSQNWVVSVASVNDFDVKASYSSFGDYVTVSAPGGDFTTGGGFGIFSTYVGGGYNSLQGTSMASPMVASVAGLIKSHKPELSTLELFTRIKETADNIDAENPSFIGMLGSGRVNVYRAITEEVTPKPEFVIVESLVDDETGNNNGKLDPGETVMLKLRLRNIWAEGTNLTAELSADSTWPVSATENTIELGTITGILDTTGWEAEISFELICAADALPMPQIPLTLVINGTDFSQQIAHYISISPMVLFVADFEHTDNAPLDHSEIYRDAFVKNNIAFDYVHHLRTDITYDLLSAYPAVVWGCEWTFPSLDANDRNALSQYLDNGGRLFISGQDIGWDMADEGGGEYVESGGTSKVFYNNYLKASYLADDASRSMVYGVDGDPVSDGLSSRIFQPNRDATQQYPDEVEPIGGAEAVFTYTETSDAAIRYAGDFRVVYLGFGGFEAISDEDVREKLMGNTINWLNGLSLEFVPLKDTENTDEGYPLQVNVNSEVDEVEEVLLYWNTEDVIPYNKVVMTAAGDDVYTGEIPAQDMSDVYYFIFVKTASGSYLPFNTRYQFHVGPDEIFPQIALQGEPQANTIDLSSRIEFEIQATDNIGIDTESASVTYWSSKQPQTSSPMVYEGDDVFSGGFSLVEEAGRAGNFYYYFSVNDISLNHNVTVSDTFSFSDTTEYVTGFEEELDNWNTGANWDISSSKRNSGSNSMADSKIGDYQNNVRDSLTYMKTFDLSAVGSAWIDYYLRYDLEKDHDYLHFQVSPDSGLTWQTLKSYTSKKGVFVPDTIPLHAFTGPGMGNVTFRFLIETDDSGTKDGVYIDDITITVSEQKTVGIEDRYAETIPAQFYLNQNYPNPFNPSTMLEFGITSPSHIRLQIFNLLGQEVSVLADADFRPGKYRFSWNGTNHAGSRVASGVYMYKLTATSDGQRVERIRKMVLLR